MRIVINALILTVLFPVSQTFFPVPRQTSDTRADSGHQIQKQRSNKQKPTIPSSVMDSGTGEVSQDARDNQGQRENENSIDVGKPIPVSVLTTWWERLYVIFTGLVVIAAVAGAYYANRTLRTMQGQLELGRQQLGAIKQQIEEMHEQALVLKSQVDLQTAAMRQWVMLTNWEHSVSGRDQESPRLEVKLIVVNPTRYPIKLLGCRITCRGVTVEDCVYHTLVPDQPFTVRFSTHVTREEMNERYNEGLVIRLSGRVAFIDILDTRQDQTFSGFLLCRRHHTYFTAQVSDIEAQKDEDNGQRDDISS